MSKTNLTLGARKVTALGMGKRITDVAKAFAVSKQNIHYWAKKGLDSGWLTKDAGYQGRYHLTKEGRKRFLRRDEGVSINGLLPIRVHGAELAVPVVSAPEDDSESMKRLERDSREVPLQHWVSRHLDVGGLRVKLTPRNLIVYVNSHEVDAEAWKEEAILYCMLAAQEVAAIFANKYGFKLNLLNLKLVKPPQYALPDAFTGDDETIRLSFSKGNIDYSKSDRELEYSSAAGLADFLSLPERVQRLEDNERASAECVGTFG